MKMSLKMVNASNFDALIIAKLLEGFEYDQISLHQKVAIEISKKLTLMKNFNQN